MSFFLFPYAQNVCVLSFRVLSKSFRTLSSIATYLAGSAFALLRATPAYRKQNLSYQYLNKNTVSLCGIPFL